MRLLALAALLAPHAHAASGGPDAGGYVYTDSDEASGPVYAWLDSTGGTSLGLGDDEVVEVTLPFEFEMYGTAYSTVSVSSNGVLFFVGATATATGGCPSSASSSHVGVAALWQDLGPSTITTESFGTWPYRTFVISWTDVPAGGAGGTGAFQVWLLEGRDEVVVQYADLDFGDAAVDGGVAGYAGVFGGGGGLGSSCLATIVDETAVWFGAESARPARAELYTDELGTPWSGLDDFSYAGLAMATADFNDDGDDDVLLGGPDTDNGTAWLLYRQWSTGTTLDNADASFTGDNTGDDLGAALSTGDLDGDGYADLILGAPASDPGGADSGAAFVFTGGAWTGSYVASDADVRLAGGTTGSMALGTALASGDVDGDGYADLVAGAPNADGGGTNSGGIYVLAGSASVAGNYASTAADWILTGAAAGDELGGALAVGDIDADGLDDFLAGAIGQDGGATNGGAVYTVLGADLVAGTATITATANCRTTLAQSQAKLGTSVAVADVRGGAGLDLLLGAPYYDSTYTDRGAVFVMEDPGTTCWTSTTSAATAVLGATASGRFGWPVSAGDLDGNGRADLMVSATNDNTATSGGGATYVFTTPPAAVSAVATDADHALFGAWSGGRGGSAIAVAGSTDGQSLLFTSAYADASGTGTGALSEWAWHADFEDDDADGFVDADGGGNDCDDDEAGAYPGGTDTTGDSIDGDCDGWTDGVIRVRKDLEGWEWDVEELLQGSVDASVDFEGGTSGAEVAESGVTFTGATYATSIGRTYPEGALAASAAGAVLLEFDSTIDALSLQLLDADDDFTLEAYDADGAAVVTAYDFELHNAGRPGGALRGYTFAEPVATVLLSAATGGTFGIDELQWALASGTDRDGDGQTEDAGDCDDTDAAVYVGATEVLGNGVDDDCDGTVDGGSMTLWTSETSWESAAGLDPEQIDFEDLVATATIDDQYTELGATFDGTPAAATDVDGTAATGSLAAEAAGTTLSITFTEVQPALAFTLLDADGSIDVDGYVGGVLVYAGTWSGSGGSEFVGITTEYGLDELVLTASAGDTFGIDDVTFATLGLDDADGDGLTESEGDCDDADATVYTGAEETWYDGVDSDCDEGDDYDQDGDGSSLGDDCDDIDATVYDGATETWYDGIDSDCGGDSDYDQDGDGEDSAAGGGGDCDDTDATIRPSATETWYDGVDQDCAGDDDYDQDGDGIGTGGGGGLTDCDDTDAAVSPDAAEVYYDGVDNDCDEATVDADQDADGYDATRQAGDDCDDGDPAVHPDASGEACYDGVDQDCDGGDDYDCDEDGYPSADHGGDDCDDADETVHPAASDTMGDGVDQDCDGGPEYDFDYDGYDGTADGGDDCDDGDDTVNPGATDTCYDGVDQDCDGWSDGDCDRDRYDAEAEGGTDCDDADATVNPGASDFPYDGVDHDCDGASEYDIDGDGYTADWYGGTDCDDADGTVYPGAIDACYDGLDTDCGGDDDYDCDGDGSPSDDWSGDDCDDADASIGPDAVEVVGDGVDQDCDGLDATTCTDCDGDGHDDLAVGGDDCDDTDAAVYPGADDVAYDGLDADCAGDDDFDRDGDGDRVELGGGADCDDADAAVSSLVTTDGCGLGDEDCDGTLDEDCDLDTGDTGDTGDSDTADSGDDDWRPDPEEVREPIEVPRGTACGCGAEGAGTAGAAAATIGLVVVRRRRR